MGVQQSMRFVQMLDTAKVPPARMITGDCEILEPSRHSKPYLTKSEVRLGPQKITRRLDKQGLRRVPARPECAGSKKYSLQANRKTKEGSSHPDRNAQFEYINAKATEFLKSGQPAISVDTKKKEQVGEYKNGGREWRPKGQPEPVQMHDFGKQKDAPYGVYDLGQNTGWVSVGTDHDTSAFAVESIRRWWNMMGRETYPSARQLLITADSGGSNGSRVRLWKLELQKLADETGLDISVSHFPPGTSKWNKIEHRLFSFITKNWRGKPLVSHEVIVNLIAATTTRTGLRVQSQLDTGKYPKGIKVGKQEFAAIHLRPDTFHGEWNYAIMPRS